MRIVLFLLFFPAICISQTVGVALREFENLENNSKVKTLLFAVEDDNGDVFTVRKKGAPIATKYFIEKYSKDFKFLESTTIDPRKNEVADIKIINDKLVLLLFNYDSRKKSYTLTKLISEKSGFEFKEENIFSIERDRLPKYDFGLFERIDLNDFNQNRPYGIYTRTSQNELKGLLLFLKDKNYLYLMFNENLEVENTVEIAKENRIEPHFQDYKIDANENLFILENSQDKSDSKYFKIGIFSLSIDGNLNYSEKEIDKNISNMKLAVNDELVSVVSFNWENDGGFFSNTFNGSLERYNVNKKTLLFENNYPIRFSEDYFNNKLGTKKEDKIGSIVLRSLEIDDKNNIKILAEDRYVIISNDITYYVYGDITALEIEQDGNLIWDQSININDDGSKLETVSNFNLSFYSFSKGTKTLIFNNLASYKEKTEGKRSEFRRSPNRELTLYTHIINENGEVESQRTLWAVPNLELNVRYGIQLNENSIIIQGKEGRERKLLLLTLE